MFLDLQDHLPNPVLTEGQKLLSFSILLVKDSFLVILPLHRDFEDPPERFWRHGAIYRILALNDVLELITFRQEKLSHVCYHLVLDCLQFFSQFEFMFSCVYLLSVQRLMISNVVADSSVFLSSYTVC